MPPFSPPTAADTRVVLSRSRIDADTGDVSPPASLLLEQAREVVPGITLDAYALARVVASEFGNGTYQEQLAIAVADVRRSKSNVYVHAIGAAGVFGRQGSRRKIATSQDPTRAHALVAQQALAGVGREDFGSATQYFDAVSQLALWNQGRALHPHTVLTMWTFNRRPITPEKRDEKNRRVPDLGPAAATGGMQWIGPRAGVRPDRLMLFEAATTDRPARYAAAQSALAGLGSGVSYWAMAAAVAGVLLCAM